MITINEAQGLIVECLTTCGFIFTSAKDGDIQARKVMKTKMDMVFIFITQPSVVAVDICIHMRGQRRGLVVARQEDVIEFIFDVFNPKFPAKRKKRS